MTWADIPRNPEPKVLRQFAGIWLVFLLLSALHQGLAKGRHTVAIVLATAAVVVGGLGLVRPSAIRQLFRGAMMLAFPIGWLVSLVMLMLMFYVIITPIALFFRLRGRDLLCRQPMPGAQTFWTEKKSPGDLRRYFQQY